MNMLKMKYTFAWSVRSHFHFWQGWSVIWSSIEVQAINDVEISPTAISQWHLASMLAHSNLPRWNDLNTSFGASYGATLRGTIFYDHLKYPSFVTGSSERWKGLHAIWVHVWLYIEMHGFSGAETWCSLTRNSGGVVGTRKCLSFAFEILWVKPWLTRQ